MPSPFPGMDPYLENPARWPGFHNAVIVQMMAQLNALVQPRYVAMIEERVYISDPGDLGRRAIVPDVHLQRRPPHTEQLAPRESSMTAVVEPIEVELIDEEIHDSYLNIVTVEGREVVTIIEVLSPTNKLRGSNGHAAFLNKRREVLTSQSNWVEIDLLREGDRFIPQELAALGEYFIQVSRADRRKRRQVWPIKMPQPIPKFLVPLLTGDEPVQLDLQAIIHQVYDQAAYQAIIDYNRDPVPPLPSHYSQWANDLLRAKGLRSG